jgi:hypothetical protein
VVVLVENIAALLGQLVGAAGGDRAGEPEHKRDKNKRRMATHEDPLVEG